MNRERVFEELAGTKFNSMFRQLGLLIINFGEPITHSFHVGCMVRIYQGSRIILSSSDEFFTKEGVQKTEQDYERLEKEDFIHDPDSLLAENLDKVNRFLKNKTVKSIRINKRKDVLIYFGNRVVIQILPDCLERDYEYYRYLKFVPHWKENPREFSSIHYVAYNNGGNVEFVIEEGDADD